MNNDKNICPDFIKPPSQTEDPRFLDKNAPFLKMFMETSFKKSFWMGG